MTNPYLRLQVRIRPTGSVDDRRTISTPLLRRVLGKALVDSFCVFGNTLCQPQHRGGPPPRPLDLCHHAAACPYGVLYAASLSGRPPFALYLWPAQEGADCRRLEITLFREACALYCWAIGAFGRALRKGLGRERRPWLPAGVDRVRTDRSLERICGSDLPGLPSKLTFDELDALDWPAPLRGPVTVHLLGPTRLVHDGHLLKGDDPVPFSILLARCLDRLQGVFGPDAADLLGPEMRREMEDASAEVPILRHNVRWREVPDYSSRTGSEMLMGGKVGELTYGAEASRFMPVLEAAEILHVGKNPTAGCGRIRVDFSAEGAE